MSPRAFSLNLTPSTRPANSTRAAKDLSMNAAAATPLLQATLARSRIKGLGVCFLRSGQSGSEVQANKHVSGWCFAPACCAAQSACWCRRWRVDVRFGNVALGFRRRRVGVRQQQRPSVAGFQGSAFNTQGLGHPAMLQALHRRAWPNQSFKLTRYGSRRLAAPGASGIFPSAASRRLPPRSA